MIIYFVCHLNTLFMFFEINDLHKKFGAETVLGGLDLQLGERQMLSILGRSGCGKTTLLKIIAGLEQSDAGMIKIAGKVMNEVSAHQRNIVYMYQEPLLFPHLSVFENVAFGLRLRKMPRATIEARVLEMLEALELSEQARKMPHQLSGGQRQRVAFGRALIINPQVLLLDEPFGALDTETRQAMQVLLKRIMQTQPITAIFVTHDLKEAIIMGDAIGMMEKGKLAIFPDKKTFIAQNEYVKKEINFWQNL